MKGDFTRFTFDRKNRYHGVLQQQGRVQLDADWNEQNRIESYRTETGAADVIGASGGPLPAPGFEIKLSPNQKALRIGAGHYYVNGILCELDDDVSPNAQDGLPADAKIMTVTAGPIAYTNAPETGVYLAYLDVWLHHLTALEQPTLRETALGGPDHATREKLMAHVKFLRAGPPGTKLNCVSDIPAYQTLTSPNLGKLNARTRVGKTDPNDPCIVNPGAGYRRLENQLYRIEVHQPGNFNGNDLPGNPTFKWSRDNASITARWDGLDGNDLIVSTPGRDKVVGFASGQWVELTDDNHEISGEPGILVQVTSVNANVVTINPGGQTIAYAQFPKNPKIRRWDSPGALKVRFNPDPQSNHFLALEGGIEIAFGAGAYRSGDYWLIPARTSGPTTIGDIEWPRDLTTVDKTPIPQAPFGIAHAYDRLALLEFNNGNWTVLSDCRRKFAPLTEHTLLFMLGGDGQEATPNPAQPTIRIPLGQPLRVGVSNGGLPVPGASIHFQVTKGDGQLEGGVQDVVKPTDPTGVATCNWSLDAVALDQQVTATLLNAAGTAQHLPIVFTASLSRALEVSFDPVNCPDLAGQLNVQAAIETLCKVQHAGCATYVISPIGEWTKVLQNLQPGENALICFQRGDFNANQTIVLKGLGHIRLTGTGPGSRIVVAKQEVALLVQDCASVAVSELSLVTPEEELLHAKSLNGVLTVLDCPTVSVEDVSVRCASGIDSERTCITIRSTHKFNPPLRSVTVRGCDLTVGHDQYGIVVVDAERTDIDGNWIHPAPLPASLTLEKQVTDPNKAKRLARQLVANAIAREGAGTADGNLRFDFGNFSLLFNSSVPRGEWAQLIAANPPTAAQKASKDALKAYADGLVATTTATPSRLATYNKQLTNLRQTIGDQPFQALPQQVKRNLLVPDGMEVKDAGELEKSKRSATVIFADRRVLFDSALSAEDWHAVLITDSHLAPQSNAELYKAVKRSAQRIVTDATFRGRFAPARTWFEGLRARAARPVLRTGIVCGGSGASKVSASGNVIEGAAEAIRIAFSHAAGPNQPPDFAEDILVHDNRIQLRTRFETTQELKGMLVGNARRLIVSNNVLTTDSPPGDHPSFLTGIHIWGHFGMVLIVRDNVIHDATNGILILDGGKLPPPPHKPIQQAVNWQVTGNWTNGLISVPGVTRRDNVPAP